MMNERYVDEEEAKMMNEAAKNYKVKIRNLDGKVTECDNIQAIYIETAEVADNQLIMFTDKNLAEKVAMLNNHRVDVDVELDGLHDRVRILECAVSGCKEGSRRHDKLIEDQVNMIDVKYGRKVEDLFDLVGNLGRRVVELEKGKEEPEFTTPDRVMDLMELCRNHRMSFTFDIDGEGLIISAKSNDGKYAMVTNDIPEHLLMDPEGIRKHVVKTVRKSIESMEEMRNGQTKEN